MVKKSGTNGGLETELGPTTFVNEHQYIQLCKWMQSHRFREPPPGFEFIKETIGR